MMVMDCFATKLPNPFQNTWSSNDGTVTILLHKNSTQLPHKPQVLLKIPTSELSGIEVPRPHWGQATRGREYYVNSFPNWGNGGYRQFLGTTKSFSEDWIVKNWGK